MFAFLRTRRWVVTRRLILIIIVVAVAIHNYGDAMMSFLASPHPQRDITITRSEFRPDVPGSKPTWIIRLKNSSRRFAYDRIQLEASYFDKSGTLLQKDKLVVHQRLNPGEEQLIGSSDFKERGEATNGTLQVLDAQRVK